MDIGRSIWLQSSRSYSDVRFNTILNEIFDHQSDVISVDLSKLVMTKDEIKAAVDNLVRGLLPQTEGPILVSRIGDEDRYQLINGYHRVVVAILADQKYMMAKIDGQADWQQPEIEEIYRPDWTKRYKGLEDFVEVYQLKHL